MGSWDIGSGFVFVPKHFSSLGKKATCFWLWTLPLETGHHGNRIPVSKIRTESVEPSQHGSPPPQHHPYSHCHYHKSMHTQTHSDTYTQLLGWLSYFLLFSSTPFLCGWSDSSSSCPPHTQGTDLCTLQCSPFPCCPPCANLVWGLGGGWSSDADVRSNWIFTWLLQFMGCVIISCVMWSLQLHISPQ